VAAGGIARVGGLDGGIDDTVQRHVGLGSGVQRSEGDQSGGQAFDLHSGFSNKMSDDSNNVVYCLIGRHLIEAICRFDDTVKCCEITTPTFTSVVINV
jgi:hypothetical protein